MNLDPGVLFEEISVLRQAVSLLAVGEMKVTSFVGGDGRGFTMLGLIAIMKFQH